MVEIKRPVMDYFYRKAGHQLRIIGSNEFMNVFFIKEQIRRENHSDGLNQRLRYLGK